MASKVKDAVVWYQKKVRTNAVFLVLCFCREKQKGLFVFAEILNVNLVMRLAVGCRTSERSCTSSSILERITASSGFYQDN